MNPFQNTSPELPHRLTEADVARYRSSQGDDTPDDQDAARKYENPGFDDGFGCVEGLCSWPVLISAVSVMLIVAVVVRGCVG